MYVFLLWICGKKIPGRLRKQDYIQGKDFKKQKTRIVFAYHFVLIIIILVSILAIKYTIRGGL